MEESPIVNNVNEDVNLKIEVENIEEAQATTEEVAFWRCTSSCSTTC